MYLGLNAGLVGLTISYAMSLTWVFQWTIRQSAEVENQVNASFIYVSIYESIMSVRVG